MNDDGTTQAEQRHDRTGTAFLRARLDAVTRKRMGLFLLACTLVITLGCLPLSSRGPTPIPAEALPPLPGDTPRPTWPPTWTPTWTPTATFTPTPRPTFSPVPATPEPGGGAPAAPPPHAGGPLTIDYKLNGASCPSGHEYVAYFTIWASGGDGRYTYFRDIDQIGSPTSGSVSYELKWKDCGGAPGTFYVRDGSKHEASVKFWVHPPDCCD